LIQKTENALLREIIAKKGIEAFLEIENRVNLGVDVQKTVIAPGGSVIYCKEAMEHFKKLGIIIYLKVPFEIIKKRIPDPEKRGVVLAPDKVFLKCM
jgi:shikimate kinase